MHIKPFALPVICFAMLVSVCGSTLPVHSASTGSLRFDNSDDHISGGEGNDSLGSAGRAGDSKAGDRFQEDRRIAAKEQPLVNRPAPSRGAVLVNGVRSMVYGEPVVPDCGGRVAFECYARPVGHGDADAVSCVDCRCEDRGYVVVRLVDIDAVVSRTKVDDQVLSASTSHRTRRCCHRRRRKGYWRQALDRARRCLPRRKGHHCPRPRQGCRLRRRRTRCRCRNRRKECRLRPRRSVRRHRPRRTGNRRHPRPTSVSAPLPPSRRSSPASPFKPVVSIATG